MTDLFALDDPHADLAYFNIRAPTHEGAARARANCDELWRHFEPYASKHFLAEFPYRFHQRWFEMYLAVALLRAGLEISCPKENAPDVRVQHRDGRVLWLEAVAPTGGDESNPDRVVYPPHQKPGEPPVAYAVPIDQVTIRVAGALHDKAKKLNAYRERGIIAPEHQAVIAINVHRIPHGVYDADRYGLGAIYGIGHQLLVIDRARSETVESKFRHRPELQRKSGGAVDVAPFLHAGFEHVSGAIISGTDAANCPDALGLDFLVLPNPCADPAYTERQVPLGHEWRLQREGDGGNYKVVEIIEHQARGARLNTGNSR